MNPSYSKTYVILVEQVAAQGDEPAGYVATNEELGLVAEADTLDELAVKVSQLAAELFELNVLPYLKEEAAAVPPAFLIHHVLGSRRDGLLS